MDETGINLRIVYDGHEQEIGLVLSVDQFGDGQIMQLQYIEDTQNKLRKYGLQLWDYPKDNTPVIALYDKYGNLMKN